MSVQVSFIRCPGAVGCPSYNRGCLLYLPGDRKKTGHNMYHPKGGEVSVAYLDILGQPTLGYAVISCLLKATRAKIHRALI